MLPIRLASALIPAAAASSFTPPGSSNYCTLIGGCMSVSAVDTMLDGLIGGAGDILVAIAGGASVLFVIIGGAQMTMAFGDEGKFQNGMKNTIYALVGFAVVLGSQILVGFVAAQAGGASLGGNPILGLMAAVVTAMQTLFNVVFTTVIIFAGLKMIIGRGKSEEFTGGKKAIGYALTGAIVSNVAVAVSKAILNAFG